MLYRDASRSRLSVLGMVVISFTTILTLLCILAGKSSDSVAELEIPIIEHGGWFATLVELGGKDGYIIVDTGASYTVLDKRLASFLRLRKLNERVLVNFPFLDVNLVCDRYLVLSNLLIGDVNLKNKVILFYDLSHISIFSEKKIFGILGFDIMKDYSKVIVSRNQILLSNSKEKENHFELSYNLAYVFNNQSTVKLPHIVSINKQGNACLWLIDTGSRVNRVKSSTGGQTHSALRDILDIVHLDAHEGVLRFPALVYGEEWPLEVAGLIGYGILDRYDIIIDNYWSKVYFVPTKVKTGRIPMALFFQEHPSGDIYLIPLFPELEQESVKQSSFLYRYSRQSQPIDRDFIKRFLSPAMVFSSDSEHKKHPKEICMFSPKEINTRKFLINFKSSSFKITYTVIQISSKKRRYNISPIQLILDSQYRVRNEIGIYVSNVQDSDSSHVIYENIIKNIYNNKNNNKTKIFEMSISEIDPYSPD